MRYRICICGGGAVAHVLVAALGSSEHIEVRLLTRNPRDWCNQVQAIYRNEGTVTGILAKVSADPSCVVRGADMVLVATPAFAYQEILSRIGSDLGEGALLGSIPGSGGFEWQADAVIGSRVIVFGLQRSPYNCRIEEYGARVRVMGVRLKSYVGARPASSAAPIARLLGLMLRLPVEGLPNYLNATLVSGNALLHPCHLYSLFGGLGSRAKAASSDSDFYGSWNDRSSSLLFECDNELQTLRDALPLDLTGIKPLKDHYGVGSPRALTRLIRTTESLKGVGLPVDHTGRPAPEHRFVREDLRVNLATVDAVARIAGMKLPMIHKLIKWSETLASPDSRSSPEPFSVVDARLGLRGRCQFADVNEFVKFYR